MYKSGTCSNKEFSGSEVQGGKIKPCSFEPSRRMISSLRVSDLFEIGALRTLAFNFEGAQLADFLISSAFDSRRSKRLRSLALSLSLLVFLNASIYSSAAAMAFLKASSLVRALSTLDSASWVVSAKGASEGAIVLLVLLLPSCRNPHTAVSLVFIGAYLWNNS